MSTLRVQPFPNTHWSLVRRAGFAEGEARQVALTTLLVRYEPVLLSYLRVAQCLSDDAANELLQAFIADKVLEYQLLQHVQEGRGRFRTFLLTSLNHFAIDRYRQRIRTDIESIENVDMSAAKSSSPTAYAVVEAAWAQSLVHNVLENMRDECTQLGRMDVWTVFADRILAAFFGGQEPVPYEQLAETLQLDSPTQAANLLVTGKRMYARMLRIAISEYESDSAEIELEIADLLRALATSSLDTATFESHPAHL